MVLTLLAGTLFFLLVVSSPDAMLLAWQTMQAAATVMTMARTWCPRWVEQGAPCSWQEEGGEQCSSMVRSQGRGGETGRRRRSASA